MSEAWKGRKGRREGGKKEEKGRKSGNIVLSLR